MIQLENNPLGGTLPSAMGSAAALETAAAGRGASMSQQQEQQQEPSLVQVGLSNCSLQGHLPVDWALARHLSRLNVLRLDR
jgi:hypothetical protein